MAQEMFKNANKVNREEKAMILEFMAGSRRKSISFALIYLGTCIFLI